MKWTEHDIKNKINEWNLDTESNDVPEDYSCYYCNIETREKCPHAFDPYNINDRCLMN